MVIKVKKIIIDARYEEIAKKQWGSQYEIIPSYCNKNLAEPVSYHPDMSLCRIRDCFVCCPESYDYYKRIITKNLIKGKTELNSHYPNDIAYNILVYGEFAFGKKEYIDPVIKEILKKQNIEIININQGYAKCSCAVSDKGIITADSGIYDELTKNSINALKITPGFVKLSGYDYGFVGGASGEIDGILSFFGDVSKHPDFENIKNFCEFDFICDFPLTDVGTIYCI